MTYSILQDEWVIREFNTFKEVLIYATYNTGFYVTHNKLKQTIRWTDIYEASLFGEPKVSDLFTQE